MNFYEQMKAKFPEYFKNRAAIASEDTNDANQADAAQNIDNEDQLDQFQALRAQGLRRPDYTTPSLNAKAVQNVDSEAISPLQPGEIRATPGGPTTAPSVTGEGLAGFFARREQEVPEGSMEANESQIAGNGGLAQALGLARNSFSDATGRESLEPVSSQPSATPKLSMPAPRQIASESSFAPQQASMTPEVLDFNETNTLGTVDNLRDAQQEAAQSRVNARFGRAMDKLTAGLAGHGAQPAMEDFYKDAEKQADIPVENLKALVEQEKSDPKSGVSQGFKKYLERFGVKINGDISASTAAALMPNIYKNYADGVQREFQREQKREEIQGRKEIAGIQANSRKEIEGIKAKNKTAGKTNKGKETLDKEFAKQYNDWTSGGAKTARSEIQKLKAVANDLKSGKASTGGATGMFPDRLTTNKTLQLRSAVEGSIMKSLRAVYGPQFTEKEGERYIKTTWNEADSTKNNMERVNRLITELEGQADDKDRKAKEFESKGSLSDFQPMNERANDNFDDLGFEEDAE